MLELASPRQRRSHCGRLEDLPRSALLAVLAYAMISYVWPIIDCYRSPAGDIPRIKRNLDGEARRVIEITSLGGDFAVSRSGSTGYRQYRVVLELPDKTTQTRLIDLQPSLLGDSTLWEWRAGRRGPLTGDS